MISIGRFLLMCFTCCCNEFRFVQGLLCECVCVLHGYTYYTIPRAMRPQWEILADSNLDTTYYTAPNYMVLLFTHPNTRYGNIQVCICRALKTPTCYDRDGINRLAVESIVHSVISKRSCISKLLHMASSAVSLQVLPFARGFAFFTLQHWYPCTCIPTQVRA